MAHTILEKEIYEQPQVVKRLLADEIVNVKAISRELKNRFQYIVIAARGTSDNAARYAQYVFGAHNHIQVSLATPSLYTLYHEPPDMSGALVVSISQSGQSPDIISVISEGKKQGCPTLAITNQVDSPLAQNADYIIPLHAGPEKSIAATKSYTSSLAALALFSSCLANNSQHLEQLIAIPDILQQAIIGFETIRNRVERYRYMEHTDVIGRGYNYSTAFEIALKIKELTHVVAEAYSSADFRHGPIATVQEGFPVILIAPKGITFPDMVELAGTIKQRNGELLIISDDEVLLNQARFPMSIPPGIPEWLTPLVAVSPGQLFSMYLTLDKGLDPDNPKGLSKVTETI